MSIKSVDMIVDMLTKATGQVVHDHLIDYLVCRDKPDKESTLVEDIS